jgi:ABC-2 type transport system ATP-binding protein
MKNIIEVNGISKSFGSQTVLENVYLTLKKGEILGLLGPNGAGKTTLIRILNGVIKPDQGSVAINGIDPIRNGNEVRKITGVVTESAGLYPQMNAEENLKFFGALYGVKDKNRIDQLLNLFDLELHKKKPVGKYSTGMKKRLALAKSLLHKPSLLFLDEPTNGLDPDGIKKVLLYLKKYSVETGTSIVICSHVLHHLEDICDSFAFLENRTIVERGTKAFLEEKYITVVMLKINTNITIKEMKDLGYSSQQLAEQMLSITLPSKESIPTLLRDILTNHSIFSVEIVNQDLESIYFKVREKANEYNHH